MYLGEVCQSVFIFLFSINRHPFIHTTWEKTRMHMHFSCKQSITSCLHTPKAKFLLNCTTTSLTQLNSCLTHLRAKGHREDLICLRNAHIPSAYKTLRSKFYLSPGTINNILKTWRICKVNWCFGGISEFTPCHPIIILHVTAQLAKWFWRNVFKNESPSKIK